MSERQDTKKLMQETEHCTVQASMVQVEFDYWSQRCDSQKRHWESSFIFTFVLDLTQMQVCKIFSLHILFFNLYI